MTEANSKLAAGVQLSIGMVSGGGGDSVPIGSSVQLTIETSKRNPKTESYDASDPTSITLFVIPPNSSVVTYAYPGTIVRDGRGRFHYNLQASQSGEWLLRWQATFADGSQGETADLSFVVAPSQFIPG